LRWGCAAIEFCYNLSINGITCNLITYLTVVLGKGNVASARSVSTWQATSSVIPLVGAILANSYWGRYRTMVISFSTFVVGDDPDSSLGVPAAARQERHIECGGGSGVHHVSRPLHYRGRSTRSPAMPDVLWCRPVRRRRPVGAQGESRLLQLVRVHHVLRVDDSKHRHRVGARPLRLGTGPDDPGRGTLLPGCDIAQVQVSANPWQPTHRSVPGRRRRCQQFQRRVAVR
uniref:Uncharacterized protein n=1 Tax=Aegilops tauschii subsp. strangulata TaxID=200361 RepID=A0A453SN53_AEGTS